MRRLLLISPAGTFFCRSTEFNDFMQTSRDIHTILHHYHGIGVALATLAALTPPEFEIRIVDENKEPVPFDIEVDIVGISAMTQQATRAYEIADEFRRRGRHVVLGGIHPTVMPEEAKEHADTVVIGEAENTWPLFCRDFLNGSAQPVYAQQAASPVDMTRIPVPRFDLLSKYKYSVVYIQATRGCPHDCEFCVASNVYGKRYKHKTVEQIRNEVRELKKHWRYAQVGFADDNMFVDRGYSKELVAELRSLNTSWFAICDIAVAQDEKFLRDLHESGCRTLLIGFESVSPQTLHGLNNNQWKEKRAHLYPEYIDRIQRNGIGVFGSFIFGLDDDQPSTVDETIRFVAENNIMGVQFTLLTPFPGSRLRKRLESEKRILHDDWQGYTAQEAVIRHPRFTPTELERSLLRAYKESYSPESNERRARYFRRVWENLQEAQ